MYRMLCGLALVAFVTGSATAQDIAGKAEEAQTLAGDGKYIEAMAALDEAANALWDQAPLSFRKVLWVAEPPGGSGLYNPREDSVFDSGAEMIAYVEPVGFGWRKSGDVWVTDLVADLVVKSKEGEVLASQPDFNQLQITSRVRNREFMARFTYTFTGIQAGEYLVETVLHDKVSGKDGTFSLPITVR
jgi:hypothetical protein